MEKSKKTWPWDWRESHESRDLTLGVLGIIFCVLAFVWLYTGERGLRYWYNAGSLSSYLLMLGTTLGYYRWAWLEYQRYQSGVPFDIDLAKRDFAYQYYVMHQPTPFISVLVVTLITVQILVDAFSTPELLAENFGKVTDQRVLLEPWRILTGSILHNGWFHMFNNVFIIYAVGKYITHMRSQNFLIGLIGCSLIASDVLNALYSNLLPLFFKTGLGLGISGAGGAMLAVVAVDTFRLRRVVPKDLYYMLFYLTIVLFLIGFAGGPKVGHGIHTIGFTVGLLVTIFMPVSPTKADEISLILKRIEANNNEPID